MAGAREPVGPSRSFSLIDLSFHIFGQARFAIGVEAITALAAAIETAGGFPGLATSAELCGVLLLR